MHPDRSARSIVICTVALLAGAQCGNGAPTGEIVEVKTDLAVPLQIDRLKLFVRDDKRPLYQRDFMLGTAEGQLSLPASLALSASEDSTVPVRIEVQGFLGTQLMIARSLHDHFLPHVVRSAELMLSADCLGAYCPSGETCQPMRGCVPVDGRSEADQGPTCDCNSYFPVCRGASWTYEQRSLARNIPTTKAAAVQAYAPMDDNAHAKVGVKAFLQFRLVDGGLSRRWLTTQGPSGAATLSYEKDEWFDADWGKVLTTYYVPRRVRLDETHVQVGDSWTVGYQQFDYRRDGIVIEGGWTRADEWSVVAAPEQARLPAKWSHTLCQRRVGQEIDQAVADQIYCFVRGVGKVYEITAGHDEDSLTAYRIPGCGEMTP
jgi:hypothetical protein